MTDDRDASNNGLMYAHWTGLNWNIKNLGNFLNNTFNSNSETIEDMQFDSKGNPHLTVDVSTGTIRGARLTGNLTYAALDSLPDASQESWPLIAITTAFTAIIIAVIVIGVGITRKHKKPQSQTDLEKTK